MVLFAPSRKELPLGSQHPARKKKGGGTSSGSAGGGGRKRRRLARNSFFGKKNTGRSFPVEREKKKERGNDQSHALRKEKVPPTLLREGEKEGGSDRRPSGPTGRVKALQAYEEKEKMEEWAFRDGGGKGGEVRASHSRWQGLLSARRKKWGQLPSSRQLEKKRFRTKEEEKPAYTVKKKRAVTRC